MAGTFEIRFDEESGKYQVDLKSGNGQVVATSRLYSSRKSALEGIRSIRVHAPDAVVITVKNEQTQ